MFYLKYRWGSLEVRIFLVASPELQVVDIFLCLYIFEKLIVSLKSFICSNIQAECSFKPGLHIQAISVTNFVSQFLFACVNEDNYF